MSTREVKTFTCDDCGKNKDCRETYYPTPNDPWVHLRVYGGWMTDFGSAARTELDACSPKCALGILKKACEQMQRLVDRFPEGTR